MTDVTKLVIDSNDSSTESAGSAADFSTGSAGSAADFSTGSAGSAADFSTESAGSAADFPGARGRVYLNACSVGLPPREAEATYARFARTMAYFEDATFGALYEELVGFCDALARFVGVPEGSVWVDQNASSLLGRFVTALAPTEKRFRVITSDVEFPSAEVIFRAFASRGAELVIVPSSDDGATIDAERVADAIDERTLFAFVSHSATVSGARLDPAPIARA